MSPRPFGKYYPDDDDDDDDDDAVFLHSEGLYTPFIYVTQKAVSELDVSPAKASLILSMLGACSTVSRIVTGILADRPEIDCLILHNGAAIVAGVATCFVGLLDSYVLLVVYGAVFGTFTGMRSFHSMHTVVDRGDVHGSNCMVWYGIVEFNVPLDTVSVISETRGPEQ